MRTIPAAVIVLSLITTVLGCGTAREPIRLEAESGTLHGPTVATTRPSHSGSGYVTGIQADDARVVLNTAAPGGVYEMRIGYASPRLMKGYELDVNGLTLSDYFAPTEPGAFAVHRAGKVELAEGENTLTLRRGWGYYDVDYIDLIPADAGERPEFVPATLSDAQASPETRALMERLTGLYGRATLSGVYSTEDLQYVREVTGEAPAVVGGDLMDYSPSRVERGASGDGLVERLVGLARDDGHIIALSWHWNAPKDLIDGTFTNDEGREIEAPWWRGFYTEATRFDVEQALADERSEDYQLLLRDIDIIGGELRKLADAGVPVLWRPLHEAEGTWFWWGAKGPKPLVELWRLMHDRLTNHHGLHNLIWVYTTAGDPAWYPGDAYVDVVGVDVYPADIRDPLSGIWERLHERFGGRKLLALTEFGGTPDVPRMQRLGVWWSYFNPWTGDLGPRKNDPEQLKAIYADPGVMSLEDLREQP